MRRDLEAESFFLFFPFLFVYEVLVAQGKRSIKEEKKIAKKKPLKVRSNPSLLFPGKSIAGPGWVQVW